MLACVLCLCVTVINHHECVCVSCVGLLMRVECIIVCVPCPSVLVVGMCGRDGSGCRCVSVSACEFVVCLCSRGGVDEVCGAACE